MKTKLFIYSITDRKISRTYGGTTYKFSIYEVVKNDFQFIASGIACNRGHKGSDSEAFGVLLKERPELKKLLLKRANRILKTDPNNYNAKMLLKDVDNSGGYYFRYMEEFGVKLKISGDEV